MPRRIPQACYREAGPKACVLEGGGAQVEGGGGGIGSFSEVHSLVHKKQRDMSRQKKNPLLVSQFVLRSHYDNCVITRSGHVPQAGPLAAAHRREEPPLDFYLLIGKSRSYGPCIGKNMSVLQLTYCCTQFFLLCISEYVFFILICRKPYI